MSIWDRLPAEAPLIFQLVTLKRLLVALLVATASTTGSVQLVHASPSSNHFYVRDDPGGHVALYVIKVNQLIRSNRQVRFVGRCESACTLYLSVPESRACIVENAVFGFHLPYGGDRKANEAAAHMMLSAYPDWVRAWIADQGGLTQRIKSMGYDYARQFLPDCQA
ncbi:hypothetical protein [Georhizobium sp. MAB10]|uniref:hypothetical protein n=1 Tax=Georhizobium sp. MAB10 TaxID=3028319 RepID=UPI0038559067